MTIITFGEHLWACVVYYVMDQDLNFYFISPPKSIHASAIESNQSVAIAITDSHQEVTDEKVGVSITGRCKQVVGVEQLQWFFRMWAKINPGNADQLNYANYAKKLVTSKVYKIKPEKIRFFHEGMYEGGESPVHEI